MQGFHTDKFQNENPCFGIGMLKNICLASYGGRNIYF